MVALADYRQILKAELVARISKNPSYSLRALAREARVSPAMLSCVLNGKKRLSVDSAFRLCRALKFSKKKTEYFTTLLNIEGARSQELKASLQDKLNGLSPKQQVHNISVDHFRLMADWYHFAIIELAHLPKVSLKKENSDKIAAALGISKMEVESALERLLRLELLREQEDGSLIPTQEDILASATSPNEALRKYHRQMLTKATEALTTQTPQEKIVGSETFAFNEEQLPKAAEIIEECFERLVALAKTAPNKNSVYHVGIQLFRMTRKDPLR